MESISRAKAFKYLRLAKYQADLFSKDPSTKVGSLFVAPGSLQILTSSFNGFPRGVDESDMLRWQRPQKYNYVEHAERNGIYNASRRGTPLEDSICVVTMFPCSQCARALIQVGVKYIVSVEPNLGDPRWGDEHKYSLEMFKEVGIELILFNIMQEDDVKKNE